MSGKVAYYSFCNVTSVETLLLLLSAASVSDCLATELLFGCKSGTLSGGLPQPAWVLVFNYTTTFLLVDDWPLWGLLRIREALPGPVVVSSPFVLDCISPKSNSLSGPLSYSQLAIEIVSAPEAFEEMSTERTVISTRAFGSGHFSRNNF